jgi:hypothetical protein
MKYFAIIDTDSGNYKILRLKKYSLNERDIEIYGINYRNTEVEADVTFIINDEDTELLHDAYTSYYGSKEVPSLRNFDIKYCIDTSTILKNKVEETTNIPTNQKTELF